MFLIRIKKINFIICASAMLIVQQCLMHRFSSGYIGFDLLALLAAFMTLRGTAEGALPAGLFLGILRDMGSTGRAGYGTLSMLAAVGVGIAVKKTFNRKTLFSDLVFSFVFLLSSSIIYTANMILFSFGDLPFTYLYHAVGSAAFTALLVPPFFSIFRLLNVVEEKKTTF